MTRNYRARSVSQGPTLRRRGGGNDPDERTLRAGIFKPERDPRELEALARIAKEPTTLAELREHLGHSPTSSAARLLVERLVEEGLVERRRRGRFGEFHVTDAGREVLGS